jgi:hypothetical protein
MAPTCTATGASGRRVSATTLTRLLREEVLPRIAGREWYFCPDPDCNVVYFTADGETLPMDALTVRVGVKESGPPRPLCYCFGYDFEDVEREAATSEESAIAAAITEKCRQGLDRCEETNPQGSCCLGNVRRAFQDARRVRHEAAAEASEHDDCCATKPRKEGA